MSHGPQRIDYDLPRLPDEPWREDAVCASHPSPWLWDHTMHEAETRQDREYRHAVAKRICWNECPVRVQCLAATDPRLDEGVRGGKSFTMDRHDLRRMSCPECDELVVVSRMSRHNFRHHKEAS